VKKNTLIVLKFAAIVQTSVRCLQGYAQEVRLTLMQFASYVQKYAKRVLKNVQNTQVTASIVLNVLRCVRYVQTLVLHNLCAMKKTRIESQSLLFSCYN
jgi:hypothetical protein